MGTYAVTGSASGMGRETAQRLRDGGHTVIGVDIRSAEVVADLSTPAGRKTAADGVLAASGAGLDGAMLAAGLGPAPGSDRPRQIAQVNKSTTWASSTCSLAGGPRLPPLSAPKSLSFPVIRQPPCPRCRAAPSAHC